MFVTKVAYSSAIMGNQYIGPEHIHSPCAGSEWFCFQQPEESLGNGPHPLSGYYGNGVEKAEDKHW